MAVKEIAKDIRFFNQNALEVESQIDYKGSADDANDSFSPIICTHLGETKTIQLKKDATVMICTIFDCNSSAGLSNVSDSFPECKNVTNKQNRQAPPIAVETEIHENFYSEIDSDNEDSENDVSD